MLSEGVEQSTYVSNGPLTSGKEIGEIVGYDYISKKYEVSLPSQQNKKWFYSRNELVPIRK
jgi:hypothetical protein